jgi:hypothetical protein
MTLPMRNQKHYCRHCRKEFVLTVGFTEPQHLRAYKHVQEHHPTQALPPIQCSKYCSEREQPEEQRSGVKLYGPGRRVISPIITYDKLFPEGDDHT